MSNGINGAASARRGGDDHDDHNQGDDELRRFMDVPTVWIANKPTGAEIPAFPGSNALRPRISNLPSPGRQPEETDACLQA